MNTITMLEKDVEVIRRWRQASAETQKLLREADALIEWRVALARTRSELFRDLTREASSFVDAVAHER